MSVVKQNSHPHADNGLHEVLEACDTHWVLSLTVQLSAPPATSGAAPQRSASSALARHPRRSPTAWPQVQHRSTSHPPQLANACALQLPADYDGQAVLAFLLHNSSHAANTPRTTSKLSHQAALSAVFGESVTSSFAVYHRKRPFLAHRQQAVPGDCLGIRCGSLVLHYAPQLLHSLCVAFQAALQALHALHSGAGGFQLFQGLPQSLDRVGCVRSQVCLFADRAGLRAAVSRSCESP